MADLTRKQYLLRKTLDELEIVADWNTVNKEVVNHVLKDMASNYRESETGIDFGYDHKFWEISDKLNEDLEIIRYTWGADFFKKELNPRIKEKILEYKDLDSFEKINSDLYQTELEEQMLYGRDKFLL